MKPQRTFIGNEGDFSVDNRGPEALKKDTDALMKMFDPSSTHENGESGGIGADNLKTDFTAELPVKDKDGMATKLQLVLNMIYDALANTYSKLEADAKIAEETSNLVGAVDYESGTGVFKIKNKGGETVKIYDTPIEKIPANFKLAAIDNKIYLVITNEDGTSTRTNVSSLIDTVSVKAADGDPILVSLSQSTTPEGETQQVSKTFTLSIQDASLNMSKFAPDVVAKFEEVRTHTFAAANSASQALEHAESAGRSAFAASHFKEDAESALTNVLQVQDTVNRLAGEARTSNTYSAQWAINSKSYAVGGTASREGEDTDNAKYYAEKAAESAANAAASAGGDFVPNSEFNTYKESVSTELGKKALKTDVPTKTSDLTNDSDFIKKDALSGYVSSDTFSKHNETASGFFDSLYRKVDGIGLSLSPYSYWSESFEYYFKKYLMESGLEVSIEMANALAKKNSGYIYDYFHGEVYDSPAIYEFGSYPDCKGLFNEVVKSLKSTVNYSAIPNITTAVINKAKEVMPTANQKALVYLDTRMLLFGVALREEILSLQAFLKKLPDLLLSYHDITITVNCNKNATGFTVNSSNTYIPYLYTGTSTLKKYIESHPDALMDIYTDVYGVCVKTFEINSSTKNITATFDKPLQSNCVVKLIFKHQVPDAGLPFNKYKKTLGDALDFYKL